MTEREGLERTRAAGDRDLNGVVATIVSVRAGRVRRHARPEWDHVKSEWDTAYWKDEASGPVRIGTLGLEGDEQADKRHHGGPHKAVLMYCGDHYEGWRKIEGLGAMGPGAFAENLTLQGADERALCIGDELEVGTARLQIASPRGPCMDISRRWNQNWLLKRVVEARRPGWYLRVRQEGTVAKGDSVRLLARPHPEWTVERVLRVRYVSPRELAEVRAASEVAALAPDWKQKLAELPARD